MPPSPGILPARQPDISGPPCPGRRPGTRRRRICGPRRSHAMLHQVAPACDWGVPGDCLATPRSPHVVLNLLQRVAILPGHTTPRQPTAPIHLNAGVLLISIKDIADMMILRWQRCQQLRSSPTLRRPPSSAPPSGQLALGRSDPRRDPPPPTPSHQADQGKTIPAAERSHWNSSPRRDSRTSQQRPATEKGGRSHLQIMPPRAQESEASPAKLGERRRVRPDCLPAASSLPCRYRRNCERRTR